MLSKIFQQRTKKKQHRDTNNIDKECISHRGTEKGKEGTREGRFAANRRETIALVKMCGLAALVLA